MEKLQQQQYWRAVRSVLSYKNATIVVCLLNIVSALILLQGFLFPSPSSSRLASNKGHDGVGRILCKLLKYLDQIPLVEPATKSFVTNHDGVFQLFECVAQKHFKALYRNIKESEDIRRSMVPFDLIQRVREIGKDVSVETEPVNQKDVKQTAAEDLISRLNNFRSYSDVGNVKALEEWRKRKMERAKQRTMLWN